MEKLVRDAGIPHLENDPLRFPHRYKSHADREIVALYSALLAWGKRSIILAKLEDLFSRMKPSPKTFIMKFDPPKGDPGAFKGFVHRTYRDLDVAGLAVGIRAAYESYGGLEGLFRAGLRAHPEDMDHPVQAAFAFFTDYLKDKASKADFPLVVNMLPDPRKGGALKRLNLFLRWMVRSGEFDLGIWKCIHPENLIVPLDLVVGRAARCLGFTTRKANDWKAAVEITHALAQYDPRDPTRYDFALSQLGCPPEKIDNCRKCGLR